MVKIGLSVLKTGGVPILNWNTVLAKTAPDKLSRTSYLVRKCPREYRNVPSIRQHSGDDGHSVCWKKCHFGLTQKKFVNEKKNAESWLYDPKATSKVSMYF